MNLIDKKRTFCENELKLITIFANNAAVAINNTMLYRERKQRLRFQTMLEQLHSPQVVRELVKKIKDWENPNQMRKKVELTTLFADIRGFSSMVSVLELEEIMDLLDEFYGVMTRVVFNNGGSIDKFIGDEVMAFFGAPMALKNPAELAVKTAMEMVVSFQELKEKFSGRNPLISRNWA